MEMPWADWVTNMAEEKYGKLDGCMDVLWFGIDRCPSSGKRDMVLSRRCDNALLSPSQTPLGMRKEEAFAGPCDSLRTGKKILNQNQLGTA